MEKIIFKQGYFNDIKKVHYFRKPAETAGTFKEIVVVYYNKWYKMSEKFEFNNREEANALVEFLADKLNQNIVLKDIVFGD